MANKETIGKTIGVVVALSLVCSILVSSSAVFLKPLQERNKALDKQTNILSVSGFETNTVSETYAKHIEAKLLNLDSGEFVDGDANTYDFQKAAKDPKESILLKAAEDPAGIRRRPNVMPVYFAYDDHRNLTNIVIPVYGMGLWSTMYAYLAVSPDGQTVNGISYYEQGETPGLGAEVENPKWTAQFVGKRVYDDKGNPAIKVVKGGAPKGTDWGVDGLSGATLTSDGVQYTLDFWLGSMGYRSFLEQVRQKAGGS